MIILTFNSTPETSKVTGQASNGTGEGGTDSNGEKIYNYSDDEQANLKNINTVFGNNDAERVAIEKEINDQLFKGAQLNKTNGKFSPLFADFMENKTNGVWNSTFYGKHILSFHCPLHCIFVFLSCIFADLSGVKFSDGDSKSVCCCKALFVKPP